MSETRKLMCVLAHPDDETLGPRGVLARYAAEGVETSLVTATRGERGWPGDPQDNPGPQALGRLREQELRAAAELLGVRQVLLMHYCDGELPQARPAEAISALVLALRAVRPQVVITFDPLGVYGHPDHIAVAQLTLAAVVAAANPAYPLDGGAKAAIDLPDGAGEQPAHTVAKVYAFVETRPFLRAYEAVFGEVSMEVGGERRSPEGWPGWGISAEVDVAAYWEQVAQAAACHRTQRIDPEKLREIARRYPPEVWGKTKFYRLYSLVNLGQERETDLFARL